MQYIFQYNIMLIIFVRDTILHGVILYDITMATTRGNQIRRKTRFVYNTQSCELKQTTKSNIKNV
jgi:hypothetical protein